MRNVTSVIAYNIASSPELINALLLGQYYNLLLGAQAKRGTPLCYNNIM